MSMHLQPIGPVPEDTARVARGCRNPYLTWPVSRYNGLESGDHHAPAREYFDYTFAKSRTRWHKQRERYNGEQRNFAALVEGPRSSR